MKHIEKHFGGINIGDLGKTISYVHLNCCLGLILMCACSPSSMVDKEAKTPCETSKYVVESCICGHHVSKDFCTPIINKVTVAVKKGSLMVGHVPKKPSAIAHCFYRLELLQLL